MKLTADQKIRILQALEELRVEHGKVYWELVIQDGLLLHINQEGGIEKKKII